MSVSAFPWLSRLTSVRATAADNDLDAVVITHPPNVRYLSGFAGSTGVLVIERERCSLVVDSRYITSARELVAAHRELASMSVVLATRSEDETIVELLRSTDAQRIGIEGASMPVARFNRLSAALGSRAATSLDSGVRCPVLVAAERLVERSRIIKDAQEVETLRRAAALLSRVARTAVPGLVRPGRREVDVAAAIDAAMREAGFERPAFETIVASGPQSALPHARPTPRVLQAGDPVLLDFGGVYDGYCVDLTRTVQLAPSSDEFRRIFVAVMAAHDAAVAAVRPGVLTTDIDYAARRVLEQHGLGEAFGHGTGHGLGLEVHEEPGISKANPARPGVLIEPGMVFTIEPGAYVPGTGGVRIEDDVLVIPGGCEVLTDVPNEIG
ncbi:MAG: Xaa-Pro peptidase family protein [Vicinamibacterales bacterium]